MAENQANNPMAPHVAIIQVTYETYEQQSSGQYGPARKSTGQLVFAFRGSDEAICESRLNTFLDLMKKEYENAQTQSEGEGLVPAQIQEAGGALAQHPQVLGLRRGFA
jgi:hypothetical protein